MNKDAGRVSGLTWGISMVLQLFWLAYGKAHNSKPIIYSAIAWFVVDILIIIGVIFY